MKRWLNYAKPYKLYFILGPICMIVEVLGEVLMPMFLGMIINSAAEGTLTPAKSLAAAGLMILTAILMMAGGVGGADLTEKQEHGAVLSRHARFLSAKNNCNRLTVPDNRCNSRPQTADDMNTLPRVYRVRSFNSRRRAAAKFLIPA